MKCGNYTLAAIAKQCKDNAGGIKAIYIADADSISAVTLDTTAETISNIVMSGSATFKKWEFAAQTGTFTSTATISEENGTLYFQNDVALVFGQMEKVKRLQIMAATVSNTIVIVKDSNNRLFYLGYDNPVSASAAGGEAGTAMGDRNGYTITLTDFSKGLPMEVEMDAAALATIGID